MQLKERPDVATPRSPAGSATSRRNDRKKGAGVRPPGYAALRTRGADHPTGRVKTGTTLSAPPACKANNCANRVKVDLEFRSESSI